MESRSEAWEQALEWDVSHEFNVSSEVQEALLDGSTDMANVSLIVPSIHALFAIDDVLYHSHAFTEAAATKKAHMMTIKVAKAIAKTTIEVMSTPALMKKIKKEFSKQQTESYSN